MSTREIAANIAGVVEEQSAATREVSSSVSSSAAGTQLAAVNIATVTDSITQVNRPAR